MNIYEGINGTVPLVFTAPRLEDDAGYMELLGRKRALAGQIRDSDRATRGLAAEWNRVEKDLIRYVRDFSVNEGKRLAVEEMDKEPAREQ